MCKRNDLDGIVLSAGCVKHVECQFPCGCDDNPQDSDNNVDDDELTDTNRWDKKKINEKNKFHAKVSKFV